MDERFIFAAVGLLFMILGIPLALRRVPPNRWYGLRVAATFASQEVWYEANAVSGRALIGLGVVLLGLALGLPALTPSDRVYRYVYLSVLLVGAVGIAVRGWRRANQVRQDRSALGSEEPAGRR
jgi:uncharacterized membrane protein